MKTFCFLLFMGLLTISFSNEVKSMESQPSIKYSQKGVLINITNNSDISISSIKVLYTGGSYTIPILEAGVTFQSYINPTSESHLEIKFIDEHKQEVNVSINTYFERNYSGSLSVFIYKGGKVTWEDNITIRQQYKN